MAQFNLGGMYHDGTGVAQIYSEAARQYMKAAGQHHASAQNNLGVMHELGLGVRQDYDEAARWYRKAAEQGDAMARGHV